MINKPLLRKVMERIEEVPSLVEFWRQHGRRYTGPEVELWDQENWLFPVNVGGRHCGTAGCFAGWTAMLNGAQIDPYDFYVDTPEGTMSISYYARQELGLNDEQESELFRSSNSKADLRRIVDGLLETPDED